MTVSLAQVQPEPDTWLSALIIRLNITCYIYDHQRSCTNYIAVLSPASITYTSYHWNRTYVASLIVTVNGVRDDLINV